MVKTILKILSVLLVLAVPNVPAVADTDTRTQAFEPTFRTIKVSLEDAFMLPPVMRIGTDDRIVISFDEIGEDNRYLEYRLIHCNADWQPSSLVDSEFIDGFNAADIDDFAFSQNTFVHYVNYRIVLPNERTRIKHSGNYLLQVYDPDEPDNILLQARFAASDAISAVHGKASSRTDRGHYSDWQQLDFAVDTEGVRIANPYQDITVKISQNGRESTARTLKSPIRVAGNSLVYEHIPDLIFPASNEYRRFESLSNSFPGMHVDSLRYMGSNYHVWLKHDLPRAYREYEFDRTQHGRFLVREYNASDSDIGADYITVNFTLDSERIEGVDVYVDGEFNHGMYTAANRMTYDPAKRVYTASIPLKQGAYNYQYVVKAGNAPESPAPIEGNKYETENEYWVEVWYRPPGARADRLIGFTTLLPV